MLALKRIRYSRFFIDDFIGENKKLRPRQKGRIWFLSQTEQGMGSTPHASRLAAQKNTYHIFPYDRTASSPDLETFKYPWLAAREKDCGLLFLSLMRTVNMKTCVQYV